MIGASTDYSFFFRPRRLQTMEQDYYSPDFDPNSLTKQRLKSILSAEGVELPGTEQKKNSTSIYLFNMFIRNPELKSSLQKRVLFMSQRRELL